MHSYAVLAPVVHLLLDADLRRSVTRFINEGTFELSPFSITTAMAADKAMGNNISHVLPKVSVIEGPHSHHHHHSHYHRQQHLTKSFSDTDRRIYDTRNTQNV